MLLKGKSIWFSRPQYFDDLHEFSLDTTTARVAIVWRLNGFRNAYNQAVQHGRSDYLASVKPLTDGLPIAPDGTISECKLKLSQISPKLLSSIRKNYQNSQESFLISCWRHAEKENVAMWSQYASMDEGIAIVADASALKDALRKTFDIRLIDVKYRDLGETQTVPMEHVPLGYKDIRFETEQEYRFYFRNDLIGEQRGMAIPISLLDVIEAVHIAPNASPQYRDMIKSLLQDYDLDVQLKESPLDQNAFKF